MSIQSDIQELLESNIITQETAARVVAYYESKKKAAPNRLFIVFAILGAILVGLGIILILAHNWDNLSRFTKTIFALLPMLAGQAVCGFTLFKMRQSMAWREGSAVFLFFAVGACIALISQIYHLPGDIGSFMLTWMLLCLPLIYVMNSSVASMLYVIGISYYAVYTGYFNYPHVESYWYWVLLAGMLPHYYYLYKTKPHGNMVLLHHWLVPISLLICMGTIGGKMSELIFIIYISLFGLYYLIGISKPMDGKNILLNPYKIFGAVGTVIILLMLSFDWFWQDLRLSNHTMNDWFMSPECIAAAIITILACYLFYLNYKGKSWKDLRPFAPVFLIFIPIFLLGLVSSVAVIFINVLLFIVGIATIKEGARQNHLGILNFGLLIIAALVACRFFDTDLSFVLRGGLFVLVGIGFFAANYWLLKRRKEHV